MHNWTFLNAEIFLNAHIWPAFKIFKNDEKVFLFSYFEYQPTYYAQCAFLFIHVHVRDVL